MEQPAAPPTPAEHILARVMFVLALLFLVLLAGILHRHQYKEGWDEVLSDREFQLQAVGLVLLWPVFLGEGLWRALRRGQGESFRKHFGFLLLVCLFPPLRVGARSSRGTKPIWLPRLGWQEVDNDLRRTLERFFSVPMVVIALMVLPLLILEFASREWGWIEAHPALEGFLAVSSGVIWFAFAAEFTVMVSVAKDRLRYSLQHWVDLAIIVLPFLQFLPLLRLLRLGRILRLEQLTRMGRVYRMQGLALKAWRAVLLLEVVQRLTGQTLEKRLKKLQDLQTAKEEELEELRQEIEDLQKRIAQQKESRAVRDVNDERR